MWYNLADDRKVGFYDSEGNDDIMVLRTKEIPVSMFFIESGFFCFKSGQISIIISPLGVVSYIFIFSELYKNSYLFIRSYPEGIDHPDGRR